MEIVIFYTLACTTGT